MSAKVSTFSRGVTFVSSGETGTQANEFEAAIKSVTSSTTVGAVFIYDTRNDSDGGAWRKKTSHTSWAREAASATRSSRSEFPSVALIVADNGGTSNVTIYDLDDPAMPMWMVINRGSGHILFGADMGSLYALNGRLYVGHNVTAGALSEISFADDFGFVRIHNTSAYNGATIADREVRTSDTVTGTTGALVSRAVNDVAATYLEGGELDSLGLVRPVVACATNGGVSVIHPNGSVYDSATTEDIKTVDFKADGSLVSTSIHATASWFLTSNKSSFYADSIAGTYISQTTHGSPSSYRPNFLGGNPKGEVLNDGVAIGTDGGLNLYKYNDGNPEESAVAYVTSDYNTGYMLGDIRFAGLANSRTEDRSVKGNDLTLNGSITQTTALGTFGQADATDLFTYSGFSSSNYLSRAYDADFDFGTGDVSFTFWAKYTPYSIGDPAVTQSQVFVDRSHSTAGTPRFLIYNTNGNILQFFIYDGTSSTNVNADDWSDGQWHQVVAVKNGTSNIKIYVDGVLRGTQSSSIPTGSFSNSNAQLYVGVSREQSSPLVNGSMSLLRISATVPTPQQIKEIYEAERPLFRAGAKCLLQSDNGSEEDKVNDLAYDSSTGLLHVFQNGQDVAESRFRGLEMVESYGGNSNGWNRSTTTIGAAAGGVHASARTAGTGGVLVDLPAIDVRGDINTADTKLPDDGKFHFSGVTTNATPLVIGQIPIAENESYTVIARVMGLRYNTADSSVRHFCEIKQQFTRRVGGDVVEETQISKLEEGDWTALDVDLDYDTGADTVRVKVTGDGSGPYRVVWKAEVEVQRISEKTYER